MNTNRREFFKRSAAAGALASVPYRWAQAATHRRRKTTTGEPSPRSASAAAAARIRKARGIAMRAGAARPDDRRVRRRRGPLRRVQRQVRQQARDVRRLSQAARARKAADRHDRHARPLARADRHRRAARRLRRVLRKAAHAHDRRRQADSRRGEGNGPRVSSRHAAAQREREPISQGDRDRAERPAGQEGQRPCGDRRRPRRRPVPDDEAAGRPRLGHVGGRRSGGRLSRPSAARSFAGTSTTRAAR